MGKRGARKQPKRQSSPCIKTTCAMTGEILVRYSNQVFGPSALGLLCHTVPLWASSTASRIKKCSVRIDINIHCNRSVLRDMVNSEAERNCDCFSNNVYQYTNCLFHYWAGFSIAVL